MPLAPYQDIFLNNRVEPPPNQGLSFSFGDPTWPTMEPRRGLLQLGGESKEQGLAPEAGAHLDPDVFDAQKSGTDMAGTPARLASGV